MELKFLERKAGKLSMQNPPKAVWAKASGKSSISPRCLTKIHHGQEQLNLTQCAPRVALLSSSLAMVTCVMGITGGWTFIFQWYDDIFDDVPTGGLVTVVAFSNGTRSSTLDLPSRQLCSSITASSIRKRPECRLGDIGQMKLTKFQIFTK